MDKKLTLKQKLFCDYYLELMGNGVRAVIKAGYSVGFKKNGKEAGGINKNLAALIASENIRKPKINSYLKSKLEEQGLNDICVKRHHLSLITQDKDLRAKNKAIDMYYKMTGQYLPKKFDIGEKVEVRVVNYGDGAK